MKPILETIDTRFGTASKHAFSRGNTLPYTGVPFGMNYFVPQTSHLNGSWYFNPTIPIFQGIRLTHQPSPWIGDFSWLLLTPVTEKVEEEDRTLYIVTGEKIERFAIRTNFDQEEGVDRLRDILKKLGIAQELLKKGAESDSIISISGKEFTLVRQYED